MDDRKLLSVKRGRLLLDVVLFTFVSDSNASCRIIESQNVKDWKGP